MSNIKFLIYIILIGIIFFSGFFFGRDSVKIKEIIKTEYIKGDTIRDTLYTPIPKYIELPIDTIDIIKACIKDGIYQELWPEKVITEYIKVSVKDTTKMLEDWATKRIYDETLFNHDTIGTCKIKMDVQYNRWNVINYKYIPVIKKINETKYHVKTFSPFIGVGYLTNNYDDIRDPLMTINGGFFIKEKYGFQLQVIHGLKSKNDYLGGSLLMKF